MVDDNCLFVEYLIYIDEPHYISENVTEIG